MGFRKISMDDNYLVKKTLGNIKDYKEGWGYKMATKTIAKIVMMAILILVLLLTALQAEFKDIKLASGKIAFVSNRNEHFELFMVDHQGNDTEKIVESDDQIMDIAISPDLRYVILREVETVKNNIEIGRLYLYDREKRRKRLIDHRGTLSVWSPDGEKFIYVRVTDDFKFSIVLTDPQLKKKEVLLYGTGYSIFLGLSWSPDSSELLLIPYVYDYKEETIDTLYRYIIKEKELKKLKLDQPYNLYSVKWSPVERVIAAGIYDPELAKNAIALINPDSGEVRQLATIENHFFTTLSLSPDGNYLVFSVLDPTKSKDDESWEKMNIEVYVYDIKNDQIRNISNSPLVDYVVQWIP